MATLVYASSPMLTDRVAGNVAIDGVVRLDNFLEFCRVDADGLTIVVDGRRVDPAQTSTVYIHDGSIVAVHPAMHGGFFEAILPVAQLAATALPFIPGVGPVAALAVNAAIAVAGSLLVKSNVDSQVLEAPADALESGVDVRSDPVWSISTARNAPRRYQPMMIIMGRIRVTPDLAAQPYTRYRRQAQWLYQMFHFGIVESGTTLRRPRIGNTDLDEFDIRLDDEDSDGDFGPELEVSDEDSGPGDPVLGKINLFARNVDTLSVGAAIERSWVERRTSLSTTEIEVSLSGVMYELKESGGYRWHHQFLDIEYRKVGGSSGWKSISGSAASKPYTDNQVRVSGKSPELRRYSYEWRVREAQYDVRIRRRGRADDPKIENDRLNWDELLSYQPDPQTIRTYRNQKRVALKIRASGQLNGRLDEFSMEARAYCRRSNPNDNPVHTRNPAWWFLHVCRGIYHRDGWLMFGAGLSEDQIDVSGIAQWATWCSEQDLKLDIVFRASITTDRMLATIARVGRATVSWSTGKLGVIYDEADKAPVTLFGMSNIVENSFRVSYLSQDTTDEVVATYQSRELNYEPATIRAKDPSVNQSLFPVDVNLRGVTRESQAQREANLLIASQIYHRRRITWETDWEGLPLQRGDVVALSHDLTAWGISGRILSQDSGDFGRLTLSRPVKDLIDSTSSTVYMQIKRPEGTVTSHTVVTTYSDNEIQINPTPGNIQGEEIDYTWALDVSSGVGKNVRITGIEPRGENRLSIVAIDEDPSYYASEWRPIEAPPVEDHLGRRAPRVLRVEVSEGNVQLEGTVDVTIDVTLENASGFLLHIDVNQSGSQPYGVIDGTLWTGRFETGDVLDIEVSAWTLVQLQRGFSRKQVQYVVTGLNDLPPDVEGFTSTRQGRAVTLGWFDVRDPVTLVRPFDLAGYEIRKSEPDVVAPTWNAMSVVTRVDKLETLLVLDDMEASWYAIKAFDILDNFSLNATFAQVLPPNDVNIIFTYTEPPWNSDPGAYFQTVVVQSQAGGDVVTLREFGTWNDMDDPWDDYTQAWDDVFPSYDVGYYETVPFDISAVRDVGITLTPVVRAVDPDEDVTWKQYRLPWSQYRASWGTPVGGTIVTEYEVDFRSSEDGVAYTDWGAWLNGTHTGRFFQWRIWMRSDSLVVNAIPFLTEVRASFDLPERVFSWQDVATPSGGRTTFVFDPPFVASPNVQAAIQDAGTREVISMLNKTNASVEIGVLAQNGQLVAGVVDVLAVGY